MNEESEKCEEETNDFHRLCNFLCARVSQNVPIDGMRISRASPGDLRIFFCRRFEFCYYVLELILRIR
jgi:hypothetical protein